MGVFPSGILKSGKVLAITHFNQIDGPCRKEGLYSPNTTNSGIIA